MRHKICCLRAKIMLFRDNKVVLIVQPGTLCNYWKLLAAHVTCKYSVYVSVTFRRCSGKVQLLLCVTVMSVIHWLYLLNTECISNYADRPCQKHRTGKKRCNSYKCTCRPDVGKRNCRKSKLR